MPLCTEGTLHHSHPSAGHRTPGAPATFQNHIDFLLTSTERQQFKDAIEIYQDSQ